jgi:short-subunit dehydrogenase
MMIPGMLERMRGHVVNIASVAGKAAVPYNIVYSATKHGLIGFTLSLRAEMRDTGVSASVVCPGYVVEAGMYAEGHIRSPRPRAGTGTTPREVGRAVARAIEKDKPDTVVAGVLPRLSELSFAVSPTAAEAIAWRIGGYEPMRREAEARRRRGD